MRAVYSYDGWAPWNKELSADSLKKDVIKYYEEQWNIDIQKLTDGNGNNHTISIQGNREIEINKLDNGAVEVLIRDLRVEKKLERFYKLNTST